VYCKTVSLKNRVAIAIGIVSLGFRSYFERLFVALGIELTDNVLHYIKYIDKQREYRLEKEKKSSTKKVRMKRKFELLREDEQAATRARNRREGQYKSGGHMQPGGFDAMGNGSGKPKASTRLCPHCGLKGHVTTRSKQCLKNPKNPNYGQQTNSPQQIQSASQDAIITEMQPSDDVDAHDAMPFDAESLLGVDINEERDKFHDCGTWSEDEEGIIHVTAPI
jgi:hypothetical protein